MKALVVDDSLVMRKVMAAALARAEITDVDEARDGLEAVEKAISGGDYAIILMDWNLPNKNGAEALRDIRRAGGTMPILLVTMESEKDRLLDSLKFGPTGYLVKPFTPQAILAKLQEALAWQTA
jgi:two-component system chemotaxis response regulator CheY